MCSKNKDKIFFLVLFIKILHWNKFERIFCEKFFEPIRLLFTFILWKCVKSPF